MKARAGIPIAIALGLLEAAWTSPGHGGPANVWLGGFAILVVLLVTTWPNVWAIPVLAIVEEWTHLIVGYGVWLPTGNTLFHHWSISYLGGVNIYPWLTFPVLTLLSGWAFLRLFRRGDGESYLKGNL